MELLISNLICSEFGSEGIPRRNDDPFGVPITYAYICVHRAHCPFLPVPVPTPELIPYPIQNSNPIQSEFSSMYNIVPKQKLNQIFSLMCPLLC